MTDLSYPSVCVELLYPFGRYRISTGADSGYGATLGVYEDAETACERAHEISGDVFVSLPVRREIDQAAAQ